MTVVPVIPVLQFEFSGVSFVPEAVSRASQDRPFVVKFEEPKLTFRLCLRAP